MLKEMAMSTSAYEVPTEMREFAERSVAQARKAFEGFMGAVQKSTTAIEAPAGNPALTGAKDMSAKAVSFAESNVNAAFDLAEKLVHAKDIQEVMALQTEFLKAQMANIQAQAKELGETMQKASGVKK